MKITTVLYLSCLRKKVLNSTVHILNAVRINLVKSLQ